MIERCIVSTAFKTVAKKCNFMKVKITWQIRRFQFTCSIQPLNFAAKKKNENSAGNYIAFGKFQVLTNNLISFVEDEKV